MKNEKNYIRYSKFWSVSLEHFVERKPLISEEWQHNDDGHMCEWLNGAGGLGRALLPVRGRPMTNFLVKSHEFLLQTTTEAAAVKVYTSSQNHCFCPFLFPPSFTPPLLPISGFVLDEKFQRKASKFAIFYIGIRKPKVASSVLLFRATRSTSASLRKKI